MADYQRDELKQYSQACIAAFQFLTRIPIRKEIPFDRPILHKAVIFFPIVGVMVGLLLTLFSLLLLWLLPPGIASIGIVLAWVMLTGGLHLDGLMDTADGVLSGRAREKMLDIMKDSRVGAMGVLAAIFVILSKTAVLFQLLQLANQNLAELKYVFIALTAATLWSRWWMVAAIAYWKPARTSGLGQLFQGIPLKYVSYSTVVALFIYLMPLIFYMMNYPEASNLIWLAMLLPITSAIVGYVQAKWLSHKLGGLTGDTYGAMTEMLEVVNLFVVIIFMQFTGIIVR